jgi:GNAT superfamily N-acetyltransferase
MKVLRTNSSNSDFRQLCRELDSDLNERYGRVQSTYDNHNVIEDNQTAIVGYLQEVPVASGCFKQVDPDAIEIKRMFVTPPHRRKGFSSAVLAELEAWGRELGHSTAMLETGKGQSEAIGLYRKAGYEVTDNYGPYVGIENSVCMRKKL